MVCRRHRALSGAVPAFVDPFDHRRLPTGPIDGSGSLGDRGRVPEHASQNVRAAAVNRASEVPFRAH
jgi:hypothetical protein